MVGLVDVHWGCDLGFDVLIHGHMFLGVNSPLFSTIGLFEKDGSFSNLGF